MKIICTAKEALQAAEYWIGYYEKSSPELSYTRDKSVFEKDKGSNNYSYAGYVCHVNGQPWCAAAVSLKILEACKGDFDGAKYVMHGVWPYINCGQLWDAAPLSSKGRRGYWTPLPGDVIVFTNNGKSRDHTGIVYSVDNAYVYTYEGNSSNADRARAYPLNSSYIYGYVRPRYADGDIPVISGKLYGPEIFNNPTLHELSQGCAGPEVKTIQRIIFARGIDKNLSADGEFGKKTKAGVIALQKQLIASGVDLGTAGADGVVGVKTWPAILCALI